MGGDRRVKEHRNINTRNPECKTTAGKSHIPQPHKKAQFHERTKRQRPFPHPPAATEKVVSHVQRSCLYAGGTVYHP